MDISYVWNALHVQEGSPFSAAPLLSRHDASSSWC